MRYNVEEDSFDPSYLLSLIGMPKGFCGMDVIRLWGNKFRVNIFIKNPEFESERIMSQSYFMESDGFGNLIKSQPELATQPPKKKAKKKTKKSEQNEYASV